MKTKVDLSIAITAHTEGLLAHKTMRSVLEAAERVDKEGYTYEIIIHIDNGDKQTEDYFARYKDDKRVRIFKNHFGDLGSSRNYIVSVANGEYVSFLDADDLVSDNWYVECLKKLTSSKEDLIVHPEAVLTFGIGQQTMLTIQKSSLSRDIDTLLLIGENRWCAVATASRKIFLETPYFKKTPGYNYEDWVFNIHTMEKGIRHEVVSGTVLFYRRSDESMLSKGLQNHATIPYVKMFERDGIQVIKELVEPKKFEENKAIRRANMYRRVRSNRVINALVTPAAVVARKTIGKKPKLAKMVPDFVMEEWVKMNHIETQLYPYQDIVNGIIMLTAGGHIKVGNAYCRLMEPVHKKPDYIFIAPWIIRGGADKVLINYIKALSELNPKWHFVLITTLPSDNSWASKLPDNVNVIDFGNHIKDMTEGERDILFTRIITQLQCKNLHIINSEYGYRWLASHKDLIRNRYNVTTSLFASGFIPGSDMRAKVSYDNPFLLNVYDVVKKVFTDNKNVIQETTERNGYGEEKFIVHYQPVVGREISKTEKFDDDKVHILWASRVVFQKLPSVAAEIAKRLDSKRFVIDAYGEMSDEVDRKVFDGIPALKYHGKFNGFDSLMDKKYDTFLYTSLFDGVPNAILEAAFYGIPIVASNEGGVSEFIQNGKTGILIDDPLDIDAYVEAINELATTGKGKDLAKNAEKLIKERHSWDSFCKKIGKDFYK